MEHYMPVMRKPARTPRMNLHLTKRQMVDYLVESRDPASMRHYMAYNKADLVDKYIEIVGFRNLSREQQKLSVARQLAEIHNRMADRGTTMANGSSRMRMPRVN